MKMLKKMMMWSLGAMLTITLAITGVSPAIADSNTPGDGYTAPAPTKVDASGATQDGFIIPGDYFEHPQYGFGGYQVNGKAIGKGFHKLKAGVTSVTITTDYNSGLWTFNFTADEVGKEAKNRYWAVLGECHADFDGDTDVTLFVENVDDDTNLPIEKLTVWPDRPKDSIPVTLEVVTGILDGETREIPLMEYQGGLYPGTWNIDVFVGRVPASKEPTARVVLWVPACGDETPPDGDYPPGKRVKPKAWVKQMMCRPAKARVVLNNHRSTRPVMFRLVRTGKPTKVYRVPAGKAKRFIRVVKPGGKVKVFSAGKVLVAKKMKPRRRC